MTDQTWSLGDVLEYVEHPTRMVRCTEGHEGNAPFVQINKLGEILNKLPREEQEELVSNFIDTIDQIV